MKNLHHYMKPGICHFKAYPEGMAGEATYESIKNVVTDDFFEVIEVCWMNDPVERDRVSKLLNASEIDVAYAAQPAIITEKLNMHSPDEDKRQRAIKKVKECVDEANHLGATRMRVMSHKDPGDENREKEKELFVKSLNEVCEYAREKYGIFIALKIFDRDIDKESLIGTFEDSRDVAKEVDRDNDNFGVLVDFSHFPLLGVEPDEVMHLVDDYVTDFHIGTCVLERSHPAYGDKQPRFGIEYSENTMEDLADYFELLLDKGHLDPNDPPFLSVESRPYMAEDDPEIVIVNAKRVWKRAWRKAVH